MDFIAIDFETANGNRNSACELAIVKVENFKIVNKKSFRIRPNPNNFHWYNTQKVHGIKAEDVEDKPSFDFVYNEIREDFEKYPIIAHNASFDISVLRNSLDLYGISYPETSYVCTRILSKKTIDGLISYGLKSVSKYFQIGLNHHKALSDASACAEIAIRIFKDHSITDLKQLSERFGLKIGKLTKNNYSPFSNQTLQKDFTKLNIVENHQPDSLIYGKNVVITGALSCGFSQNELYECILGIGGNVIRLKDGSVKATKSKTHFLVIGDDGFKQYEDGHESKKIKDVKRWKSEGSDIQVLSEHELLQNINF